MFQDKSILQTPKIMKPGHSLGSMSMRGSSSSSSRRAIFLRYRSQKGSWRIRLAKVVPNQEKDGEIHDGDDEGGDEGSQNGVQGSRAVSSVFAVAIVVRSGSGGGGGEEGDEVHRE